VRGAALAVASPLHPHFQTLPFRQHLSRLREPHELSPLTLRHACQAACTTCNALGRVPYTRSARSVVNPGGLQSSGSEGGRRGVESEEDGKDVVRGGVPCGAVERGKRGNFT
jgi:hypothetical protein